MSGRSAVAALSLSNPATGNELVIPAATVPDEALSELPRGIMGMTDRFARFALMASDSAIRHAELEILRENPERCGVASGSCMNGITEEENGFVRLLVQKKDKVHPFTLIRTMPNGPAAFIAMVHGLSGPAYHFSTTCSSSSVAIGEASRLIRHGYADVMIAGGTETLLTYSAVNCWTSAALLAPLAVDDASTSCRPFDANRCGTVLAEGATFVVLEEWEHVRGRNGRALAELIGYACNSDASHVTHPSVEGQALPMRMALLDASMSPSEVGYLNAHGTGTKANDSSESAAIHMVFGSRALSLPISSSKAAVGHMVGASGAFGMAMCIGALLRQQVPPTANWTARDPDCDLDYVPDTWRSSSGINAAMCNAFGFGGTSASLIVCLPK